MPPIIRSAKGRGDIGINSELKRFSKSVGGQLGVSPWRGITQQQIDLFADATGDHQWIHVDPERARLGPFGTTVAHGYLTLAILPSLVKDVLRVDGVRLAVNYGLNRVRFTAPVPVGAQIRAVVVLEQVAEMPDRSLQLVLAVTVELQGQAKPACLAETITRIYFDDGEARV